LNVKLIGSEIDSEKKLTSACTDFVELIYNYEIDYIFNFKLTFNIMLSY